MSPTRSLPTLVAGLLLSLACSPVAHLRPASGVGNDRSAEVGAALALLGPRPYVEEPTETTAQLWGTYEPANWIALSSIVAFDDEAFAGGLAARWNAIRGSSLAAGIELELGYAWAATSLGAAARLFQNSWIYTAPRVGTFGSDFTFGIPAGLSVEVYRGFSLRGEVQLSWAELQYYNRRQHFAAGVAYQW